MPGRGVCINLRGVAVDSSIDVFLLQEFRLLSADTVPAAVRIVAAGIGRAGVGIPLLSSIDDERDVATIRVLHRGESTGPEDEQRHELGRLVRSWQPPARYQPRMIENTPSRPAHYRLAVTGSGINNATARSRTTMPRPPLPEAATSVDLLWIGVPEDSYAGLLVLLGDDGGPDTGDTDPSDWRLALSRSLGVRIYETWG
jgi:hypothetical protein